MDPDATYRQMMESLGWLRDAKETGNEGDDYNAEDVENLMKAVEDIDEWLRKGGFLPAAWLTKAAGVDRRQCPCADGLPDPCTLCGEPADGTCRLPLRPL